MSSMNENSKSENSMAEVQKGKVQTFAVKNTPNKREDEVTWTWS